jgi:hypothetical protein
VRVRAPCLALALLTPGLAKATEFNLNYQAPEGCPPRERMLQEILARTDTARLVALRTNYMFTANLVATDNGSFLGDLTIEPKEGRPSIRTVDGPSCEEVVSALALITALTLDPNAQLGPVSVALPPALPKTVEGSTAVVPEDPTRIAQQVDFLLPSRPTVTPQTSFLPPPRPTLVQPNPQKEPPATNSLTAALGAHGTYATQLAPTGMFLGGLDGELRRDEGPYAKISLEFGPSQRQGNSHGEYASFSYLGAELLGGWQVVGSQHFGVDLGWLLSVGSLRGQATEQGRVTTASAARAWFAGTGPSALFRWHTPGVALGHTPGAALGLGVATTVALSRPKFNLELGADFKEKFFEAPSFGAIIRLEGLIEL